MRWVLVASTGFSRGFVAPFVANQGPCTESYNCLVRIDAGSQQGTMSAQGRMRVQLGLPNLSF